jgi:uncharacterized protein (TIGR02145 family)
MDSNKNITANFGLHTEIIDVTNPITGRTWMDRNLGATRVAQNRTDQEAYGYLFQWGRGIDGHQKRNSPTTKTLSNTDSPGNDSFILSFNGDWRNPKNDNLWQGVNGVNNPCPEGYRIPTNTEWNQERLSFGSNNSEGAFESPLKLTTGGYRDSFNGSLTNVNAVGNYWTSTVSGNFVFNLFFFANNAAILNNVRGTGYSVRCIKD